MGSSGIANEGQCNLSEMPGSSCMDLSLVGAGLVWFLADLRLEQVSLVWLANFLQVEAHDQF